MLHAQELTPRRWSHLPIDTNFAGTAYVYTDADIFIDPVLQVEDLQADIHTLAFRYIRSLEFLGTTSRFEIGQAVQDGTWQGLLQGEPASTTRRGLTDTVMRFSSILYGAPPLKGKAFKEYRQQAFEQETLIGAALIVQLPTGDYSAEQLINIGSNRFTFRPQFGVIHQRRKWTYELSTSAWIYSDNDKFWQGTKRQQDPFYTLQGHVIYTHRPGVWCSASTGYGVGGQNRIDGIHKADSGENFAFSLAAGYSLTKRLGLTLSYTGTRTQTEKSFDSNNYALALSWLW
ncbi:transporter [Rubritalea marina]|uniref:transporter n=1 Tax=Rubritalea marina TaxID=361055 RepID=UPI000365701D|nr:transporter [Rubritalea marina]